MTRLKLDEIKITSAFAETTPSEKKMSECRYNWNLFKTQDRYLVLDDNYYLIDGYVQYLVLKEKGAEYAEVKFSNKKQKRWYRKRMNYVPKYRNESTTYVYGVHPSDKYNKERVWRIPKNWLWSAKNIQVGDSILCETKNGKAPVIVTKVEALDTCPVDFAVKKVSGKQIRRNGMILKL